jgi:hypothetical protein
MKFCRDIMALATIQKAVFSHIRSMYEKEFPKSVSKLTNLHDLSPQCTKQLPLVCGLPVCLGMYVW